ncbi:MAG: hypothetical protein M3R27_06525 [Bacteroidota bacterium]|nr:hypothetical protein [Bacteroidota bacterium]
MNINKNNYEAFFLDYHEESLSPEQVAELLLFVEQHPELKTEFESFETISLNDLSSSVYENKDDLKKGITEENREYYFIGSLEGTLNSVEQDLLNTFLKQHPHFLPELDLYKKTFLQPEMLAFAAKESLKKTSSTIHDLMIASIESQLSAKENELLKDQIRYDAALNYTYSLYEKTRLEADLSLVYPDKENLKRSTKKILPFYYYSAVAAAVLFIFGLFFIFSNDSNEIKFADSTQPRNTTVDIRESIKITSPEKVAESDFASNVTAPNNTVIDKRKKINRGNNTTIQPENKIIEEPKNLANNLIESPAIDSNENKTIIAEKKENKKEDDSAVALQNKKGTDQSEFLSLREMAAAKIKEKTLDEQTLAAQKKSGKVKRFSGWDLAQIVSKGVSKLTGRDLEVKPQYNTEGEVTAYALGNGMEFSRGR